MRSVLPAVLLLLALAVPADAADASAIYLSLEQTTGAWQGEHVALGAGQLLPACAVATCETVDVSIDFPSGELVAALSVVVSWPSVEDDFDVYLYDAFGYLVASATTRGGNYEKFGVETVKPGEYSIVVVPALVTDSAHAGTISLDVLR